MKRIFSLVMGLILLIGLTACGQKGTTEISAPTWQEQYDLGVRYLSEGNYEEAIIAFTAAIEIDPKQVDAYLGMADAYIGLGQTDKAEEILTAGLAEVDDVSKLQEKLDTLTQPQEKEGYPTTIRYERDDGGYEIVEYDRLGSPVSGEVYAQDGTLTQRTITEYNEDGRIVSRVQYKYGDQEYIITEAYDEQQRLVTETSERLESGDGDDGFLYEYSYTYDEDKTVQIKAALTFSSGGTTNCTTAYTLSDTGNYVKVQSTAWEFSSVSFKQPINLRVTYLAEYDALYHEIYSVKYDENGNIESKTALT